MSVVYNSTLKGNRMQLVKDLVAGKVQAASTGTATAGTLVIGDATLAGGTSFAVTFTNASTNIGGTGLPTTVGTPVVFSTSGSLPTNFTPGTTYYVLTGSTSTVMLVGATPGGAAITAGSAGSGTHTAVFGVLATFTLSTTPFTGTTTLTLSGLPLSATASATGTASKAEIRNNAGGVVVSGLTVGTSGTDVIISPSTTITSAQTVQCTAGSLTHA